MEDTYRLLFLHKTSLEFSMSLDVVRLMGLRRFRQLLLLRKHGPDTKQLTLIPMKSRIGRAHMSLLGHSYGSMTAGKVAKMIRKGVLDDLVMYGSPGSGVKDAREYNLDRGRAYVSGVNTNDAVQGIGPDGTFGKDPMKMKGIKHLANNPDNDSIIKVYVSNSGVTSRYAVKGTTDPFARHSEYLEEGTESLEDISRVVVNVPVKGEK